jgi:hypothetical protein
VIQRRVKVAEAEAKVKQVTLPAAHGKGGHRDDGTAGSTNVNGRDEDMCLGSGLSSRPCESCAVTFAHAWYPFGSSHTRRLCGKCRTYWKKFGGFPNPDTPNASLPPASVKTEERVSH